MANQNHSKQLTKVNKGRVIRAMILIISALFAFLALIIPEIIDRSAFQMQVGDVTSQDILAPYSLTFTSNVLTEKAKQEASANVSAIYFPPDPSIGRYQIEKLRAVLYYISTVRQDSYANSEQKIIDLNSIDNLLLSSEIAERILLLNNDRWEAVQTEATVVLEQIMRNTIRSNNLSAEKTKVASIIDYSFPTEQTEIIEELVSSFIIPNSLYSEELTQAARDQAIEAVNPISRSFIAGETLVRRGQVVQPQDWEALDQFDLIESENRDQETLATAILILIVATFLSIYFVRRRSVHPQQAKSLILITVIFLLFLLVGRFFVVDRTIIPYVYPIAAFSLTLAILFNLELGIILTITLGILMSFRTYRGFELSLFYIIPAIIGMLTLGKARRISSFFLSGVTIGIAGLGIILAFRLGDTLSDWVGIATLGAASILNGLASASLSLFLQYIFSQFLDITTPLQLLDLARTDHPLLQKILRESPGSYQHSLQVSNLAEQASEAIDANTMLVRVGAIYHDCGKSVNPQFFIENQVSNNIDSHDTTDPATVAATIIQHVIDGVALGKKYRLPSQVINFIKEHHGTLLTRYQYTQALKNAADPSEVDEQLFRYPGPSPQSRETALLMLADGAEARARAEKPKDETELRNLISKVINYYKNEGQLDGTDLTLKDITTIAESFFNTMRGIYHPRIQYPTEKPSKQPKVS